MSDKTAAVVALATYIVGGGVGIAWRLWWQWRRTGSTGFKGVSGNIGSAEWFGNGVDDSEATSLVRHGVFGVVRNPIYAAMFVFWLGSALIAPNIVVIVGYVLLAVSIELQVRLVEEPHLLKVHGGSYREYASTVGRFVPHTGLIH
jgi:protein-S-isoprenylcysteine O-methyltransferase Ste14